jgi:predicted AlkP superfamily pyrophosphatase or phosphodiesterase
MQHHIRSLILTLLFILALQISYAQTFPQMVRNAERPRLVVVISIDQFRADLLARLMDQFLPPFGSDSSVGGFRYLMERGSYFIDAHYEHFPLETGPGHSIILTGAYPYKTGIVANDWWDRKSRRAVYCVDDPRQKVVGARQGSAARPMGPLNLRSTTVGDELKLATGERAKVVSIALKDRVSVLLGGHTQDVSIWFDESRGNWISSTAYCHDGSLPGWVDEINRQSIPDRTLGTEWKPVLSQEAMKRTVVRTEPAYPAWGMGNSFPHRIGAEKSATDYKAFKLTPDANQFVLTTAMQGVKSEGLGADEIPDLLAIGLSSVDYAGHAFGMYSPEVFDVVVQADRQIAGFLNFLRTNVPGGLGNIVVVVTADHGASAVPEISEEHDIHAGRIFRRDVIRAAHDALFAAYGEGGLLSTRSDLYNLDSLDADIANGGYLDPYLYLNDAAVSRLIASHRAASRGEIEETAARAIDTLEGVYRCYTRTAITSGLLPDVELSRHVANAFHPRVSGDLLVVTESSYLLLDRPNQYTSSHGSPYNYDTHVPIIIAGPGIAQGIHAERVSPVDIAPTLCVMLGIEAPSGCDGVLLKGALR